MGVYIRRMKMPKTCADCELLQIQSTDDWVGKYCPLVKRYIDFLEATEHRYVDCPIVAEIQEPHGDLIDRDALEADICPEWNGIYVPDDAYSEKLIYNAPTVIGAEGSEDYERFD